MKTFSEWLAIRDAEFLAEQDMNRRGFLQGLGAIAGAGAAAAAASAGGPTLTQQEKDEIKRAGGKAGLQKKLGNDKIDRNHLRHVAATGPAANQLASIADKMKEQAEKALFMNEEEKTMVANVVARIEAAAQDLFAIGDTGNPNKNLDDQIALKYKLINKISKDLNLNVPPITGGDSYENDGPVMNVIKGARNFGLEKERLFGQLLANVQKRMMQQAKERYR